MNDPSRPADESGAPDMGETLRFHSTQTLIEEFRKGRMVILVDDEGRENEGDLVIAAEHVRPDHVNFMARYARGLICLPMTAERCDRIGVPPMVEHNTEPHRTMFTVSIDAAEGIGTGISAHDRALTIRKAVSGDARREDFVQPGHVFPLRAQPGGVLTRAGHTEASCDLARLAGLEPAAVIVEIMNEDGTMARRPDLDGFARDHQLKIGTIADLIEYRMLYEQTVDRVGECRLPTPFGEFRMIGYRDVIGGAVHLALVMGEVGPHEPALIRVHVQDSLRDLVHSQRRDTGWPLGDAMARVAREGAGVVVVLREDERPQDLVRSFESMMRFDQGEEAAPRDAGEGLRTYGVGARILLDLGVRRMRVLSAPKRIHGLSGFGLEVVEYVES